MTKMSKKTHRHKYDTWTCPTCNYTETLCKGCDRFVSFEKIPSHKELAPLLSHLLTVETIHEGPQKDPVIIVRVAGEEVYRWWDHANTDFPEDLNWEREIGSVFDSGVAIGLFLAAKYMRYH